MYSNNNRSLSQLSATAERSDIHAALHEFNKLFEDQLNSINSQDSDNEDSMKKKIHLYEEWVERLLDEIKTFADCIQEMESQTAQGLDIFTKNLNISCLPDARISALENDLNAVVKIIRRAVNQGRWNTDGIVLQYLNFTDVFGDKTKNYTDTQLEFEQLNPSNPNLYTLNIEMNTEPIAENRKSDIEQLHVKPTNQSFPTARDIYEIDDDHATIMNDVKLNYAEQEMSFKRLEKQNIEFMEQIQKLKEKCEMLEKNTIDTKILAGEVANRHDDILKLKTENMALEEQLKNKDKTMIYKDEIIKELRKNCKKLSTSTPPTANNTFVRSLVNSESSKNLDQSDNNDQSDDIVSEKSYNRKTDITSRLLEIFNFVQSSHQPCEYVYPSDSGILTDYIPSAISNSVISEEDLNNALMSFTSRMSYLEKDNVKLQVENEKLKEDLQEKMEEVKILIQKPYNDYTNDRVGKNLENADEISEMDKHLSDDGSLFKSNSVKLTNLVSDLQQEIASKNKVLEVKDEQISSLIKCGILRDHELHDLRKMISSLSHGETVEKHLTSDDGSMTIRNGNGDRHAHLVVELQQEMKSKDKLLYEKEEIIASLKECDISRNLEIKDLRKKIESITSNSHRNEETVNNLRDALDIHVKTINQQQVGNNHLENKIRDLQFYISNIDRNYILLQEKYRKLELECNDQLTTISNLRSVIEEYSKRTGNTSTTVSSATSVNSNTHNTSSIWKWWRSVHDV